MTEDVRGAAPAEGRRILIGTWGSYGDLHPALGLAIGLRARGHRVTLAAPPVYRGEVEREAIAFLPMRPDIDPHDREIAGRIMDGRRGSEFLFRHVLMPGLHDAYEDARAAVAEADLVISHPVTFALTVLAEELGRPWASYVLAPMSFFSAHDVPVLAPVPWLKPLAARWPGLGRMALRVARGVAGGWTPQVARLRAARGLPAGRHPVFEGQHSPDLVLALFSSVLAAPQPDWPAHAVVTGAVPYNGPARQALDPELAAFLAAGPPPIVFTLGTSAVAAAGRFYEESVKAAHVLRQRAVLLVGPYADNAPSVPPGADVLVTPYAPHAQLFPRAAVVVHQGGAGTLHQALAAGRPMLVVPHSHDQPDNADRAERLGVARVLTPRRYRAARVVSALAALLELGTYRAAAERVAARVRAEDGVAAACAAVEAAFPDRRRQRQEER